MLKKKKAIAYLDQNGIKGQVTFQQKLQGVLVMAEMFGLPAQQEEWGIHGFHIHENCQGGHYNPNQAIHPYHAGDLPPLFSNEGYAYQTFITNRFTLKEIIGKTVVIHENPDDFKTQPSGSVGQKLVCGVIESV